jgi:hypothetical protein
MNVSIEEMIEVDGKGRLSAEKIREVLEKIHPRLGHIP